MRTARRRRRGSSPFAAGPRREAHLNHSRTRSSTHGVQTEPVLIITACKFWRIGDGRRPRCTAARSGRGPTVLQQRARQDMNSPRDFDKLISNLGTMPRILCWKCRKLTPFELDRCEHCGSAFAGGTGGAYGSDRKSRSRTMSTTKISSTPPKRTLLEIVEDLRHVNDATTSVRGRPREKELSVRLYQCPTCGRFVSEQSTECVCGVGFAPSKGTNPTMNQKRPGISGGKTYYLALWWMSQTP